MFALAVFFLGNIAYAQQYPNKPIRLTVPAAAN